VGVARIHRGDIHLTLNALGAVTPLTTVTVTTQISGFLMSVGFKEGQLVRKGEVPGANRSATLPGGARTE
jgi:multidrug efflux system membrane fusion protein